MQSIPINNYVETTFSVQDFHNLSKGEWHPDYSIDPIGTVEMCLPPNEPDYLFFRSTKDERLCKVNYSNITRYWEYILVEADVATYFS